MTAVPSRSLLWKVTLSRLYWSLLLSISSLLLFCQAQSDGDLRLVSCTSTGVCRLEIYYSNQWGTICDDYFDGGSTGNYNGGDVACRQLGCSGGTVDNSCGYSCGSGPIWLDDVQCVGTETRLEDCPRNSGGTNRAVGSHNCGHSEDAGVLCTGVTFTTGGDGSCGCPDGQGGDPCAECAANTYSSDSVCEPCPGETTSDAGATECTLSNCAVNFYVANPSDTTCTACLSGFVSAGGAVTECTPDCPVGSYVANPSDTSCTACSTGYTSLGGTTTSCGLDCAVGDYYDAGDDACHTCPSAETSAGGPVTICGCVGGYYRAEVTLPNDPLGATTTLFGVSGDSSAGVNGDWTAARFYYPMQCVILPADDGRFALCTERAASNYAGLIRKLDLVSGTVTTFAGAGSGSANSDGVGVNAVFSYPMSICANSDGSVVYVGSDTGTPAYRHKVSQIVVATQVVTTIMTLADDSNGDSRSMDGCAVIEDDAYLVYGSDTTGIHKVRISDQTGSGETGKYTYPDTSDTFEYMSQLAVRGDTLVYSTRSNALSNYRAVYKIDLNTNTRTFVAGSSTNTNIDGVGSSAAFDDGYGAGVEISADGLTAYIGTRSSIRVVNIDETSADFGAVTTLAGPTGAITTGSVDSNDPSAVRFNRAYGLSLYANSNDLLVCDYFNQVVRKVSLGPSTSTGPCTSCGENKTSLAADAGLGPSACQWDCAADMYVGTDSVTATTTTTNPDPSGYVSTIAGVGGTAGDVIGSFADARFDRPYGLRMMPNGYQAVVAERNTYKVKLLDFSTETVSTLVTLDASIYETPQGVCPNSIGDTVYVVGFFNTIYQIDMINGGDLTSFMTISNTRAFDCVVSSDGYLIYTDYDNGIYEVLIADPTVTFMYSNSGNVYTGLALSADNHIYYSDHVSRSVKKIDRSSSSNQPTHVAGSGSAFVSEGSSSSASLNIAKGLVFSSDENILYVNTYTAVMQINLQQDPTSSTYVTFVAGKLYNDASHPYGHADGLGSAASFYYPQGLAIAPNDAFLVVSDYFNEAIRKVSLGNDIVMTAPTTFDACVPCEPGSVSVGGNVTSCTCVGGYHRAGVQVEGTPGVVTTLFGDGSASSYDGTGTSARIKLPHDVKILPNENQAVVVGYGDSVIHLLDLTSEAVTIIAGSAGSTGSTDHSTGSNARFNKPRGMCIDPTTSSFVYVVDSNNYAIRKVSMTPPYEVTTLIKSTTAHTWRDCVVTSDGLNLIWTTDWSTVPLREVVIADQTGGEPVNVITYPGTEGGGHRGLDLTSDDGTIVFVKNDPRSIYKIDRNPIGVMTLIAGKGSCCYLTVDGNGASAVFDFPDHVILAADDRTAYVGASANIRIVDIVTGDVTTLAGDASSSRERSLQDGVGSSARMSEPKGMSLSSDGQYFLFADLGVNTIRKITTGASGTAYTGPCTSCDPGYTSLASEANTGGPDVCFYDCPAGEYAGIKDVGGEIITITTTNPDPIGLTTTPVGATNQGTSGQGFVDGTGNTVRFNQPTSAAVLNDGERAVIADSKNKKLRLWTLSTNEVTTLYDFSYELYDVCVNPINNDVYVTFDQSGITMSIAKVEFGPPVTMHSFWTEPNNYEIKGCRVSHSGDLIFAATQYSLYEIQTSDAYLVKTFSFCNSCWFHGQIDITNDDNVLVFHYQSSHATGRQIFKLDRTSSSNTPTYLSGISDGSYGTTNGPANQAQFMPGGYGIALSSDDSVIYISDGSSARQIDFDTGYVTLLAGNSETCDYIRYNSHPVPFGWQDGTGSAVCFDSVEYIALTAGGSHLLVVEAGGGNRIRKISTGQDSVLQSTTPFIPGTCGSSDCCLTCPPNYTSPALSTSPDQCFYDCPAGEYAGTEDVTVTTSVTNSDPYGYVRTILGSAGSAGDVDGSFVDSRLNRPYGIAFVPGVLKAVLADRNNYKLKLLNLETETVSTLATLTNSVFDVCFDAMGSIGYIMWNSNDIQQINMANNEVSLFASISSSKAWSCAVSNDNYLIYSDYTTGIYEISISDPTDTFMYANSNGNYLSLVISSDNYIYYSHIVDKKIYRIDRSSRSNQPTFVAGSGTDSNVEGSPSTASFRAPRGLALSSNGNILYVSTYIGVMQVNLANGNYVSKVAGQLGSSDTGSTDGSNAKFYFAQGVDVAPNDAYLLVAEYSNEIVRKVSLGNDLILSTTTTHDTCLTCPTGRTSPALSQSVEDCGCLAGTYEDGPNCAQCPADNTSPFGSTSVDDCACAPGFTGPKESCAACNPGYYKSTAGSEACAQCDAALHESTSTLYGFTSCSCKEGYFRNTNDLCEACVANEYKDHVGNDDCTECTTNSETAGTGASAANQCLCSKGYENTEANTESMPSCHACGLGEYKESASNILDCVGCPNDATTLHTASFTVTDCQCVAGHEGLILTDTDTCADCDTGTFKSNTGTQDCGACPTGATSPSSSTASTDCTCTKTGYTGPNGGPCECAAGFTGENCDPCGTDTYKSTTGDAACSPCPTGSTSGSGSTANTDCICKAGFTGADGGPCNACGADDYKPTTGSDACTDCPTNTVSPSGSDAIEDCVAAAGWYGTSTTTITQCPDNSNSVEGATVAADCTCNVGYTGPDGGGCTACSEGEYKDTQGDAACTSCGGVAFYSPAASDSSDDCVCALGYTGDGTSCSACETGTYKTTTGSAACTPCDSDASSPSASTAASDCDCNIGFFGDGHTTCDACGAGTYQDVSGSTDCKDCTANSNSAPGSDESTDCVCNAGYAGVHGGPCVVCAAGQYEDTATHICENCPDNSHSLSGSTLTDCLCNAGYTGLDGGPCSACDVGQYKDLTGSSACLSCHTQATSPAGSTSSGCACLPGHTGDGVSCSECVAGKFKDTTDNVACTPCPDNSQSTAAASVCLCNVGFTGPADSCSQCGAGTFKPTAGTDTCTGCPENTHSPAQSDDVTDCVCNAGYTGPDGLACSACGTGKYKPLTGSATCTDCPSSSASPAASTAKTDCVCNAGYGGDDGGPCTQCLAGKYENTATNTCTNCPLNTNSPVGSDEVFDCFCLKGHTGGNGGDCAPCYENYYKDTTGSASCTPCMDFSTSPAGSDDVSDCVCNTGYHLAGDGTCDLECAAGYEAGIYELQCLQCPNGKYKEDAGDHSCRNCPAHSSHTLLNATSVDVCVCFHGYYKAVDGETCNACETGKFNNQAGEGQCFDCFSDTSGSCVPSTGTQTECPDLCQAPAGYQVTASGVNLEPCPANTYNDGSLTTCQTCPSPSTYTSAMGSTSVSDCICQPGYYRDNGVCTACAQGAYKSETGDAACDLCTATDTNTNTLATASTSVSDCLCIANYELRDGSCQACPAGGAKHIIGNDACIDCTDFATLADNGVHAASSCLCDPGYTGNHLGCSACLVGQYKSTSGLDACSNCVHVATTATVASDSISDCYCPPPLWEDGDPGPTDPAGFCVSSCDPGTFKGESACENCVEGTYKPDTGPHACTPCSLPRNASAAGSDSADDCSCGAGEMGLAGEHTVIQSIGALSEAGLDVQTFTSSSTIPDTNKRYKSLQLTSAIDVTVSITGVVIFKCTTDCDSFGVIPLYNLPGQLQLTMTSGTATITQYTRREVVVTHTPSWYNAAAAEALTLQENLRVGDFLFNPATAVFSTTVCVTCAPGVVCKPFI